jgi:DNA invertase Pin-like site-specific DNA recombinase
MNTDSKPVRCAVYTRKSTEEGLDQEFNSLDAQRAASAAFIQSQVASGWICLPRRYDDGGYTGGNMERPALQRLLADIDAGDIDVVVCYKLDRLSRSLLDFARMMERFERYGVAFVSITQQFNSATSMGRLVLNMLLSFAQFEREIIGERTRDKIAAARRQGKWIGGLPLLGFDIDPVTRKRVLNQAEAKRVRALFALYLDRQGLVPLARELARRGWVSKRWTTRKGHERGGRPFTKTALQHLLTNVVYIGKLRYRDEVHDGEHAAIVPRDVWDRVQTLLRSQRPLVGCGRSSRPLKGLLRCAACQRAMCPATVSKDGRRYHYYVCSNAQKRGWSVCPAPSLPAAAIERLLAEQLQHHGLLSGDWQGLDVVELGERLRTRVASLHYDGVAATLTMALRGGQGTASATTSVVCPVPLECRGRKGTAARSAEARGRLPRVSRWMALALHFEDLRAAGTIQKQSDLAILGHVSPARISQIMNLLYLAPDIQEQLLLLPRLHQGRDPILLGDLQPLAATANWDRQRRKWLRLVRRRASRPTPTTRTRPSPEGLVAT